MEAIIALWLLMHDHADPNKQWYEQQVNKRGSPCCSNNDWGKPADWRRVHKDGKDTYQVFWGQAWVDVPDYAVLDRYAPDGVPTMWYTINSGMLVIYCFAAGAEG